MTKKEFIKKWRVYFGTKDHEMEADLKKVIEGSNISPNKIGILGIIQRIIGFPFFAAISIVAFIFIWLKWLLNYVRFGGETIAYTESRSRKTVQDVFDKLNEKL